MLDHTGVNVSNCDRSKEFYSRALAPLRYQLLAEFGAAVTGSTSVAGFGIDGNPIVASDPNSQLPQSQSPYQNWVL